MTQGRFAVWRREGAARGQRYLADTVRLLVYKADPDLFDVLDYEDDDCFLDPLLFAFFTDPEPGLRLPQVFAARMSRQLGSMPIGVHADADGPVCPPRPAESEVRSPNATAGLESDTLSGKQRCDHRGDDLAALLHTPLCIPGTDIEVTSRHQPLFDRFFLEAGGAPRMIEFAAATRRHYHHLTSAFCLLRDHCPNLAEEIISVTRQIVPFQSERPYSFATLSAHGAIFLNVNGAVDEVSFIEDIAHQSGHVLFNALTLTKERFLLIDPNTPLGMLHGREHEPRTVYTTFHGLFTYVTIGEALSTLLDRRVFAGQQAHELLGRLGLVLRKFAFDLALLDRPGMWTPLGRRCLRYFENVFAGLLRYSLQTRGFDYGNQPYVFDYPRFAELNPPAPTARHGTERRSTAVAASTDPTHTG